MAQEQQQKNIAHCVPVRLVEHEEGDDGSVRLLVPRFRARWLQWLQRRLKNKYIKVSLDEIGSFAWKQMDGQRTMGEISRLMEEKLGEKVKPAGQRLGMFLGMLRRNKFVTWEESPA